MRKAYKMKGSEFFGHGSSSPAKVSDEAVVAAQDKLDHIEGDWKTPGWAKAAGKVFTPPMMNKQKTTSAGEGEGGGKAGGGGDKKTSQVKTDHKLDASEDLMKETPKLERGSVEGLNYVPPSLMFKLPNQNHKKVAKGRFSHSREEACPGTPLYRKKLDGGIQAEANDDGTIFLDESVEEGSAEERQILMHEMKHSTDMKIGKLKYDDNWIKYNGAEYPRAEGKILYEGEWVPEGGKEFPWEKH